jgi:PHS family inorganic phosphate transporter-like MFS transporter
MQAKEKQISDNEQHIHLTSESDPEFEYDSEDEEEESENFKVSERMKIYVATVGFFADAYDLFVINIVLVILSSIYGLSPSHKAIITTSALVGTIIGQFGFGIAGDLIGRFKSWILTVFLMIFAAVGSAASFTFGFGALGIAICLGIWRVLLGIGIGGEYPLSAAISAEANVSDENRARNIAFVFAAQGWGNLIAPLFVLILLYVFPSDNNSLDEIWRISLVFGALPCLASLYHRCLLFKNQMIKDKRARNDSQKMAKSEKLKLILKSWKKLVYTAGSWFIFDVVFYANGLFQSTFINSIGFGKSQNSSVTDDLKRIAEISCIIGLISIPGYYSAVFLIDKVGRKRLQQIGFLMLGIIYFTMGISFVYLVQTPAFFITLYGLSFYFANLGPNTTTFVLASELYPSEIRSTCHGISAAFGKIGGIVGAALMAYSLEYFDSSVTLFICSGISIAGFLLSVTPLV